MAHHTLQAGAPSLPLAPGMVVKLEAVDPLVDAAVTGVTSSSWAIYGYDLSVVADSTRTPPPILRPRAGV